MDESPDATLFKRFFSSILNFSIVCRTGISCCLSSPFFNVKNYQLKILITIVLYFLLSMLQLTLKTTFFKYSIFDTEFSLSRFLSKRRISSFKNLVCSVNLADVASLSFSSCKIKHKTSYYCKVSEKNISKFILL